MKAVWQLLFGLLGGLLAAGILLLVTRPPRGAPVTLQPPPTPAPLVVHVSGAVLNPGLFELPPGSRVNDAVNAAGGLTDQADAGALNLAQPLEDGARIVVPFQAAAGEAEDPPPGSPPATAEPAFVSSNPERININTASQSELESLPRIGPAIAGRIIAFRQQYGLFSEIDEIKAVDGIGEGIFAEIKDLITVSDTP